MCWAATCALSGLTLYVEDVRMGLVLLETGRTSKTGGATCTHDDRLKMVTPPLWGKYDTYGRVKVEDSVEATHAMEWVKKVIPTAGSLFDVQDTLHRGEITYEDSPCRTRHVHYALVREDVWDRMVRQGEELKPQLRGILLDATRKARAGEELSEEEMDVAIALRGSFLGFKMPETLAVLSYDKRRHYEPDLKSATDDEIKVAIDVLYVQILMQALHLEWGTGTGSGMQSSNHQVRKTWFRSMISLCEKLEHEGEE